MGLLDEKVVLITGAGGGIGRAHALACAREGARVVVNDLGGARDGSGDDQSAASRVVAEIEALGGQAVASFDSVTDPAGCVRMVALATERWGRLDAVVNNAGVGGVRAPTAAYPDDDWARTLAVNAGGVFYGTKHALRHMAPAGRGAVVNVASVAGVTGAPYVSAYVAAKHGLMGLTRALALEVAKKGVTVNAVCPGYVDTDLIATSVEALHAATGQAPDDLRDALVRHNPVGRMLTPDEVASSVAWLCHPDQAMVTGHALVLSGGEVM